MAYKLTGYAKFPDRIVTDEQVAQYVIKHSLLIDRLNPRKMVEMATIAFGILCGSVAPPREPFIFYRLNWKDWDM